MKDMQIARKKERFFRRERNQFGFTLAELLAVIAIIGIVSAFGFVNVVHHQRALKLTEEDNIAREIFTASQNHMQAAVSDGSWIKQYAAIHSDSNADENYYGKAMALPADVTKGEGYKDSNHDWRRFVVNGKNADDLLHNFALGTLLPMGSIDESVRNPGNGSIVIEYDALQGEMFGVFYSDSCSVFSADDVTTSFNTIADRSDESKRLLYTPAAGGSTRYAIGYYGVSLVNEGNESYRQEDKPAARELQPVNIELSNESKLLLKVKNPNDIQTSTYTITLYDSNGHSLVIDTNKDGGAARRLKPSGTKDDGTNIYILDSITDKGHHFSQLISKTDFSLNTKLHAAITVSRKGTQSVSANSNAADSLFGDDSDGVNVSVDNVRHLENLSYTISGLSKETNIVSATVKKDLSWNGFWNDLKSEPGEDEQVYDSTGNALGKKYYGIKNSTLAQFTGKPSSESGASTGESGSNTEKNKVTLTGFDIAPVEGTAGILADLSDDSSSSGSRKVIVSNFELKDTTVTDAKNVDAGALIGVTGNCSVTVSNIAISGKTVVSGTGNVGAILGSQNDKANDKAVDLKMTNCSVDGAEISGNSKTAGGLIGAAAGNKLTVGGCTVKDTSVSSSDSGNVTGGLIGSVATADTVKINKCSVEVSDNKTVSGATAAGGFIGSVNSANTVTIKECFVDGGKDGTVTASAASAGGFIGSTTGSGNLSVSDCYSSVLVKAKLNAGGFIGEAKGNLSIEKSYSGGRTDKDQNYSESSLNVTSAAGEAGGFIGSVFNGAGVTITNSYSTCSAGGTDCAGGFIGNSAGTLTITGSYSTGLVKADGKNGLFVGSGTISTESTGNYCLDGVKGNTGLPIIGDKEDSAVTAIRKAGSNNESAPFSVTKQAAAKPYNFTNNKYPFKTVEQLAGSTKTEGKHVGDWPKAEDTNNLKTLDNDIAILYYEEVQHPDNTKEFYYHGYKMDFHDTQSEADISAQDLIDNNHVKEIETKDSLTSRYSDSGALINDSEVHNATGKEYVVEEGYVILFDKNSTADKEHGYVSDNPQEQKASLYFKDNGSVINVFSDNTRFIHCTEKNYTNKDGNPADLAEMLGYKDVQVYYMNPLNQTQWSANEGEYKFWWTNPNSGSGNTGVVAQFYMNLYFSDCIGLQKTDIPSGPIYQLNIRSAKQLINIFNDQSSAAKYIHNNGLTTSIYQTMDISFDPSIEFTELGSPVTYHSPKSSILTGNYYGAIPADNQKLDESTLKTRIHTLKYITQPLFDEVANQEGARLAYLNIEDINANYLVGKNGCDIYDITIDNSALPKTNADFKVTNAIAGENLNNGHASIKNCTIKRVSASGSGVVATNGGTIDNVSIQNSVIGGSGIADTSDGGNAKIQKCTITGATITGNGVVRSNSGLIDTVAIQNSTIGGSGIADTSSSNISNCKISHSRIGADGIVKTANNIINCTLNDVNISGNGIASSKDQTSISGCSIFNANITGYGLIENNNGGTISDCNIINAHIQKSGFSGTNKGTINNCHLYSDPDPNQWKDCMYFNATDTLTNGYLLLTAGLQSGSFSNVFSNDNGEAGFVENNSGTIEGCSFTGSVYGDSTKGTAGFFVTNSGTIENSYSNVVVNCGETANAKGAGFGITNSNMVNYCHSAGKIFGGNNTIQAGFVYEVTNDRNGHVNNCYSAIFNMNHNSGDDPFACKSWSQNVTKNAFNENDNQTDGFLNVNGLVQSRYTDINSLSDQQLQADAETNGAHVYGYTTQTSKPYYVWMNESAGNADPYPMPMPDYNNQVLASYGDWYDPNNLKYSNATSILVYEDDKAIKNGDSVTLYLGSFPQLTFKIMPADAKQEITWQSSDPNAVSVDRDGVIHANAVSTNNVSITGTSGNISFTFYVNVINYDQPTGVKIYDARENGNEISNMTLEAGNSKSLFAVVTSSGVADQSVVWSSDKSDVATVDENGTVTAINVGTATISATTKDKSVFAQCVVTVQRSDFTISLINPNEWTENNNKHVKQYGVCITNNTSAGNYDFTIVFHTRDASMMDIYGNSYTIDSSQTVTVNMTGIWLSEGTNYLYNLIIIKGNDNVDISDVTISSIKKHIY